MMEVIIVKYVQLICLTIFMGGNYNCATLMSRTEEMKNLKVTACAARCLKTDGNNVSEQNFLVGISNPSFIR